MINTCDIGEFNYNILESMGKVTFKRTKTYQQSILISKSVPQNNVGFSSSAQLFSQWQTSSLCMTIPDEI